VSSTCSTHHRSASQHAVVRRVLVIPLLALLALSACGVSDDDAADDPGTSSSSAEEEGSGPATGIPAGYEDAIADGQERYPDLGSAGQGDMSWECPLTDAVEADGRTMDEQLLTSFAELDDGVYEIECQFFPPTPVSLRFARADDEAGFEVLEEGTHAFEQNGNEQEEDELTVGERTFTVVTWTYPTNPEAGTKYVACYLDEAMSARACLDVADSDERSEDYDAEQAADELNGILSA
jgi:hypothetical protein